MNADSAKKHCSTLRILLVILILVPFSTATIVNKCNSDAGENVKVDNQVFISGCYEPPCKLQRNSTMTVEILFTAEYDVNRLTCSVYAWIYAIPLPILGVDGKPACNNIFFRDGSRASCPLRRGQQYLYKNIIDIKPTYPKAKVVLHWALLDARNNANVFCFDVPVKVVTRK